MLTMATHANGQTVTITMTAKKARLFEILHMHRAGEWVGKSANSETRARTQFILFYTTCFFSLCIVHVSVQNTLLICRSMLIHMNQTKPKRAECSPKFNAPKAYHMFIATITASVTHSSWLPFLMNLNRPILFYVRRSFLSIYTFPQSTNQPFLLRFFFCFVLVFAFNF